MLGGGCYKPALMHSAGRDASFKTRGTSYIPSPFIFLKGNTKTLVKKEIFFPTFFACVDPKIPTAAAATGAERGGTLDDLG